MGGENNHRHAGQPLLDLAEQLQAIHFIHPQIANHQIHFLTPQHAQRFRPALGGDHAVAFADQGACPAASTVPDRHPPAANAPVYGSSVDHLRHFFAAEVAARLAAGELAFDIRQVLQLTGGQLQLFAQLCSCCRSVSSSLSLDC